MAEKPIIFSGTMVRAILEGSKTQTRRVVKPQLMKDPMSAGGYYSPKVTKTTRNISLAAINSGMMIGGEILDGLCPYSPGDLLWVREAFAKVFTPSGEFSHYAYRADNDPLHVGLKWKPSIHMPREASRITLEVVARRCERLNDISEEDAIAEGSPMLESTNYHLSWFKSLWESIYGPCSFDDKWVWVYEFRRVKP